MARTLDLFQSLKPPRKPPQKLMHVCDAGDGCCHESGSQAIVRYSCHRCGFESDWLEARTITEAKKGLPCPHCNKQAQNAQGELTT